MSKNKKGRDAQSRLMLYLAVLLVLGLAVGVLTFGGSCRTAEPRSFTAGGFSITLTDAFEEGGHEGFHAAYVSPASLVYVVREEATPDDPLTLKEYAQRLQETNSDGTLEMQEQDGFVFFEFTAQTESQNVYMLIACYQSQDAYWAVNMATPEENKEDFRQLFLSWAASVRID